MRVLVQRTRGPRVVAASVDTFASRHRRGGRFAVACLIAVLPMTGGCAYVDSARRGADLAVGVVQQYKIEGLIQADIERRRLRSARCYSPLLTPATVSVAALDDRLGARWVDDLLRDCPQFASFLSELTIRRSRNAGLQLPVQLQSVSPPVIAEGDVPVEPPALEP